MDDPLFFELFLKRSGGFRCFLEVFPRQDDSELLPAEACHRCIVDICQSRFEERCELPQAVVPFRMAVVVVVLLEIVDVDKQERERNIFVFTVPPGFVQDAVHGAPVEQSGQLIALCQMRKCFVAFGQFRGEGFVLKPDVQSLCQMTIVGQG